MTTTHDADERADQRRDPDSAPVAVALAVGQIVLNRNGVDFAFGSLPGIWDWVIGFALFMVTYVLVRRRHPKKI